MKGKISLGLDKLEVCYTASPEVYADLKDTRYRELDGFRLLVIDPNNSTKESYLQIEVRATNGAMEWERFGVLKVGSTFEEEDSPRYVWIRVDNRMLYTPFYPDTPAACHIHYIADCLSLNFNNITKLDISADSNTNYFARIKKAIRNMDLVPIVLGSAYPEKKTIISKLLYIHTADRERYRTNSISISSSEKDFSLAVYNKTEEIGDSGKEYIREWTSLNDTIHRVEVRLKRTAIKDYLLANSATFEDLYLNLFDKELLFSIFCYYSDKLLRFRSGRDCISILQL